jgi:23S rRNA (cytidine1920-2'-O)/16S rRNA (cytidine1409-2'-O)-methyltransferase
VASKQTQRIVGIVDLVRRRFPDLETPEEAVQDGAVLVNGVVVRNLRSRFSHDAAIKIDQPKTLRGAKKLAAAIDAFEIAVQGRTALDLGASSGGFTSVLVERGAAAVHAVDVGHGQLLGSLRQNPRVHNLERTNLADVTAELLGAPVDLMTADLSYLSLAKAIGQVERVEFAAGADLIALVKPMFELGLGALPTDEDSFTAAVDLAVAGVERLPWSVRGVIRSPVLGNRGAIEFLLHAVRTDAPR